MARAPRIGRFVDGDEQALVEAIGRDDYRPADDAVPQERLDALKAAAQTTIDGERTKISLRIPRADLERLKARALREGMAYQTLINSILHKAAQR
jgi:predicted DNA binding CopG/RHH family protein